jgi:hypothetical protein
VRLACASRPKARPTLQQNLALRLGCAKSQFLFTAANHRKSVLIFWLLFHQGKSDKTYSQANHPGKAPFIKEKGTKHIYSTNHPGKAPNKQTPPLPYSISKLLNTIAVCFITAK